MTWILLPSFFSEYFNHDAKMVRICTNLVVRFKQKIVKIKEIENNKVTLLTILDKSDGNEADIKKCLKKQGSF